MSEDNNDLPSPQLPAPANTDYQVILMLGRLESDIRGIRTMLENYNARMDRQEAAHVALADKQSADVRQLWEAKAKSEKEMTDKIHATQNKMTWFTALAAGAVGVIVWVLDHLPIFSQLSK